MFSAFLLYMAMHASSQPDSANKILTIAAQDAQVKKLQDEAVNANKVTSAALGTAYSLGYKKELLINTHNIRLNIRRDSGSVSYAGISIDATQQQVSVGYRWELK